jgi:16S rRNA (guanine527-N7)-methyltransferase
MKPMGRPATPTRRAADALGEAARQRMSAYLSLLAKWNRVYNLTGIRNGDEMRALHVEDALAVLPWLPERSGLRVLDMGSGGGVPGIPLAIARPDARFVLLDANGKKTAFLAQAAIELGLANVEVATARAERYVPDAPFDVVVSRAFADLPAFVRLAAPLLARGGRILAMKGALPADEIAALPDEFDVVAAPRLAVPGVAAERHLVMVEKRDLE